VIEKQLTHQERRQGDKREYIYLDRTTKKMKKKSTGGLRSHINEVACGASAASRIKHGGAEDLRRTRRRGDRK